MFEPIVKLHRLIGLEKYVLELILVRGAELQEDKVVLGRRTCLPPSPLPLPALLSFMVCSYNQDLCLLLHKSSLCHYEFVRAVSRWADTE